VAGTAAAILGTIAVVVGLQLPATMSSFGWFAYQPLAGEVFAPTGSGVFVSWWSIGGALLLAGGAAVLAYAAGRRHGKGSGVDS
jgi:heme/copper-type cytochrome/quinol oxidase subunit 1